jgi:hypothetical protein
MLRQTVSRPVCLGAYGQIFITARQLRICWCGAPPLTRTGLSFTIAAGPRQCSHSRIRVPWDSRLSQIRDFHFVSSYDSQGYGGDIRLLLKDRTENTDFQQLHCCWRVFTDPLLINGLRNFIVILLRARLFLRESVYRVVAWQWTSPLAPLFTDVSEKHVASISWPYVRVGVGEQLQNLLSNLDVKQLCHSSGG